MLRPRIIPCLLVHNKGLVKTVRFSTPKYVGDPINAVKIFNEKEVDELLVLDIDSTVEKKEPDYQMIKNLATECRMPFCYGGGVSNAEQVKRIIKLGVEKVAISSAAIQNPNVISEMAKEVGSQSIVFVMDVKKNPKSGNYEIYTHNGKISTGLNPIDFSKTMEDQGIGEISINSIDNDGMMKGYDIELIKMVRRSVSVPITALGGAGKISDIENLINEFGIIGAAAGSLFVFKGIYKAVLINYPSRNEKFTICKL
ncbi:MAG: imidazole glycerol phosphate synthase subunit HisF [Chitinophagaceae bacterium BSSC1]|nr:MAG: imidazole glycerol phosphate synthase subunit HisF [Chitinophagaceae bacterium BSSC1]